MSFCFVILRHIGKEEQKYLWRRCYHSIRSFYPEQKIIIIDDNSNQMDSYLVYNTEIIHSEYPGKAELLPYIYFLKHKWCEKMIFLHDSMMLHRPFFEKELIYPAAFLWHFVDHDLTGNDPRKIEFILNQFHPELIPLLHSQAYPGCFGVASIISFDTLKDIESNCGFPTKLIPLINNRSDRECLERIYGLVMTHYKKINILSILGDIIQYPFFQPMEIEWRRTRGVLKEWIGR